MRDGLESAVLLTVLSLDGEGYGVTIRAALQERLGRDVSLGAVYTTLDRLLAKGFVSVSMGDPTPERGGRAKKHYRIEAAGRKALAHARKRSETLWSIAELGGAR
jgi:PadR family transcriptional regulator, regulatory protein PadR